MLFKYQKYFRFLIIISVFKLILWLPGYGQDPVFTQFYHNPLQISPALAGTTFAPKIHLNSRIQWPSAGFAYNTFSLSYDQFLHRNRIGVGAFVQQDNAGAGILNTLNLEVVIAYRLEITKGHYLKLGLSLGMIQRRLNWEKLIFSDQIDAVKGYLPELSSLEVKPEVLTVFRPDLRAGLMYYSELVYVGYSIHHANTPDVGFTESQETYTAGLPVRHHLIAGTQINLGNRYFLSPAILFSGQGKINQLNFQLLGNIGTIYAGIGYRYWFEHPDAVLTSIGVQYGMFRIAYSYDLTISGLAQNTGGSHELGVVINFDKSTLFKPPFRYSDCFEAFR